MSALLLLICSVPPPLWLILYGIVYPLSFTVSFLLSMRHKCNFIVWKVILASRFFQVCSSLSRSGYFEMLKYFVKNL